MPPDIGLSPSPPSGVYSPRRSGLHIPLQEPTEVQALAVGSPPAIDAALSQTEARKNGIRYEKKARAMLSTAVPMAVFSQWFSYMDGGKFPRKCQPDAYLEVPELRLLTIYEIKNSHSADAWWQLRYLYSPVLQAWRPSYHINVVEITRACDPNVAFPEPIHLVDDIRDWSYVPHLEYGVFSWRR